jgi:hypothetical protein
MLHWIRSDVVNSVHFASALKNSCLFHQYLAVVPVGHVGAHILSLHSGPVCQKLIYNNLFPHAILYYCNLHFVLLLCFSTLLLAPAQVSHCIQITSFASWQTLTSPMGRVLVMLKCVINMLTTVLSLMPVLRQINPVHTLTSFFSKIHFNVFLPSSPQASKRFLSSFPTKTLCTFCFTPQHFDAWSDMLYTGVKLENFVSVNQMHVLGKTEPCSYTSASAFSQTIAVLLITTLCLLTCYVLTSGLHLTQFYMNCSFEK